MTVAAMLLMAVAAVACGAGGAGGTPVGIACTAMSLRGGVTSGIDLPAPQWVPAGVSLPEGLSIRLIDEAGADAALTGVVVGGEPAAVVAAFHDGLVDGGYEILLRPGFVPRATDAVVGLHPRLGVLVRMSVTDQLAEVPAGGGDCTHRDAVQAHMVFTALADVDEERARWAGSAVTPGAAVAEVSGHRFESNGECLIHDGTWRFTPDPDVVWVDLSVTPETGQAAANAMVHDGTRDIMYVLSGDAAPANDPEIAVTASGFSVHAQLNDVIGDEGLVPGTITVTCR